MKTTVINRKTLKGGVVHGKNQQFIGRPTIWGNPFKIGRDGDRETVIKKYKVHFLRKIETDKTFRSRTLRLRGKELVCYCKPLACHGDVIAEFLNSLETES